MTLWAKLTGFLAAMCILLAAGCELGEHKVPPGADVSPVAVSGCAAEAEKLRSPVRVHSAPDAKASIVTTLAAGDYVYRCNRSDGWFGIRFPDGPNVDCSDRPAQRQCPEGWTNREPITDTFG
jgi:hypothetical protein